MILKELSIKNASVCLALSLTLSSMAFAANASATTVEAIAPADSDVEESDADEMTTDDAAANVDMSASELAQAPALPTALAIDPILREISEHLKADASLESALISARDFIISGQSNPDLNDIQTLALDKLDSAITAREEIPTLKLDLEGVVSKFKTANTHDEYALFLTELMDIRFKQRTKCKYVDPSHLEGVDLSTWQEFNSSLTKHISDAIAGISKVAEASGKEAGIELGTTQGMDALKKEWQEKIADFAKADCDASSAEMASPAEKTALQDSAQSANPTLDSDSRANAKLQGKCRVAVKNSLTSSENLPVIRKAVVDNFFKFVEKKDAKK